MSKLSTSPILVLRQVSRRFRALANERQFWYDDDLGLHALIGSISKKPHGHEIENEIRRNVNFLKALLADTHLAHRLSRKTSWTIRYLDSFLVVFEQLPLFRQRVVKMKFEGNSCLDSGRSTSLDDWMIKPFFDCLSYCPALEVLSVDLDLVYPTSIAWKNASIWGDIGGTLNGLTKLRQLSIIDPYGMTHSVTRTILPTSSIASLNHFTLRVHLGRSPDSRSLCFEKFVNLTYLNLGWLTDALCDRVIQAEFRLVSFVGEITVASYLSGGKLKEMVSAPCLRSVERFEFRDYGCDSSALGLYHSAPLLDAIADLQFLQHLILSAIPFDVTKSPIFSRLTNLKSVNWTVCNFIEGGARYVDYDFVRAKTELEAAFRHFSKPPSVEIEEASF
jgi:hypothetical protein